MNNGVKIYAEQIDIDDKDALYSFFLIEPCFHTFQNMIALQKDESGAVTFAPVYDPKTENVVTIPCKTRVVRYTDSRRWVVVRQPLYKTVIEKSGYWVVDLKRDGEWLDKEGWEIVDTVDYTYESAIRSCASKRLSYYEHHWDYESYQSLGNIDQYIEAHKKFITY